MEPNFQSPEPPVVECPACGLKAKRPPSDAIGRKIRCRCGVALLFDGNRLVVADRIELQDFSPIEPIKSAESLPSKKPLAALKCGYCKFYPQHPGEEWIGKQFKCRCSSIYEITEDGLKPVMISFHPGLPPSFAEAAIVSCIVAVIPFAILAVGLAALPEDGWRGFVGACAALIAFCLIYFINKRSRC